MCAGTVAPYVHLKVLFSAQLKLNMFGCVCMWGVYINWGTGNKCRVIIDLSVFMTDFIYCHVQVAESGIWSQESPRDLKVADIYVLTWYNYMCITEILPKRGLFVVMVPWYSWEVYGICCHHGWKHCLDSSRCWLITKLHPGFKCEHVLCVFCLYRETPKASSCWTMCLTTITYWRKTTLVFDMWTPRNRG